MFKKSNYKYKIIYNNYQFYESAALIGFIRNQMTEGYYLCGMIGEFCNILKLCYAKTKSSKSCAIFHKRLDEQIDTEIENMKNEGVKIICQNNLYIIFEVDSDEVGETKLEIAEKKQTNLLSVPIKKSIVFISVLLVLSVIGLILKILLIENGNLHINILSLVICLALIINFLFYFTGDMHDIIFGMGTRTDGKIYFSTRTKFKDMLFHIGDIFKFGILLGSICISVAILLIANDGVIAIDVLKMWLICFIGGYASRLRYQRSYIYLLLIEVLLVTLG